MRRGRALALLLIAVGTASDGTAKELPLRIVAFGTSLTASARWPDDLATALSRCSGRPVEVKRVALAGSTSAWALTQVAAVAALRPDVVLVEFSINDAALNRFIGVEESRGNIAALIAGLKAALPEARIDVMAMSPASGLRGWMRPRLPAYVAAHAAAASEMGAGSIDFGPLWARMPSAERDAAIPDGLHPLPDAGSAVIVPELVRILAGACSMGVPFHDAGARSL